MKVSRNWLQNYFEEPLPETEKITDVFTFHAFEIEEHAGDMMDVKILPNRTADCLCHRGIAKELSAILDIPIKNDPLRESISDFPKASQLLVEIEDPKKCLRYMGALVRGIKIKPSPEWLRQALESVGQRSINNIVDATNFVMLNIGQPLHAFDAKKLAQKNNQYAIKVRNAKKEEKITTLTGEEYILPESTLLITNANPDEAIGIAGIKGGKAAEITNDTIDIIVESANFDGTTIRRGAQTLKLGTEASLRFQNRPSPELCGYAMRDVLALIKKIAGGEVVGVVDEYPIHTEKNREVSVSLAKINGMLGSNFSKEEVGNVFKRLGLETKIDGDIFTVAPPFERTDISIPEDLIEEVGRIIGYDKIMPAELPQLAENPDQARYRGIEKVKDFLIERGFTEISTQSFAKKGDIELANPLDKTKPILRKSLDGNMKEALERAKHYAPLVLAPNQKPKLFEIGTVFKKDGERLEIETSEPISDLPEIKDDENYVPKKYTLGAYKPFSMYPFIVRDIAAWMPNGTESDVVEKIIRENASNLLIRIDQFDRFEKEGKTSLAFRLVFQSFERTLTDDEVNAIMQKISVALAAKGYEVR
jgi:phenylalanyl-tRNA synthetase beta chain